MPTRNAKVLGALFAVPHHIACASLARELLGDFFGEFVVIEI